MENGASINKRFSQINFYYLDRYDTKIIEQNGSCEELDMLVHFCQPSLQNSEIEGSSIQYQSELHIETLPQNNKFKNWFTLAMLVYNKISFSAYSPYPVFLFYDQKHSFDMYIKYSHFELPS